jgi:hypothetical protein
MGTDQVVTQEDCDQLWNDDLKPPVFSLVNAMKSIGIRIGIIVLCPHDKDGMTALSQYASKLPDGGPGLILATENHCA